MYVGRMHKYTLIVYNQNSQELATSGDCVSCTAAQLPGHCRVYTTLSQMLHFMKSDSFGWYCISSTPKKSQRMKWLHKLKYLNKIFLEAKKRQPDFSMLKWNRKTSSFIFIFLKKKCYVLISYAAKCDCAELGGQLQAPSTIGIPGIRILGRILTEPPCWPDFRIFIIVEIKVWGCFYLARSCLTSVNLLFCI